jgi:nicotinamidase-related amidase
MILLVVDMQIGLDDPQYGERSTPRCEAQIGALLTAWRDASLPVLFTRHLSRRPNSPLAPCDHRSQIKPEVGPCCDEVVFTKSTNSAFKSPQFAEAMERLGCTDLAVVGMATDACVTATGREAHDLGYTVTVVGDATATFEREAPDGSRFQADVVHNVALAALAASGIWVATTENLVQQVRALGSGQL